MLLRQKKNDSNNIANISAKEKFIFIHIPKNAGTSIYKALGLNSTLHHTAIEYKNILGRKYSEYFKFVFARHPIDRFVSLYTYAKMEESYYHSSINPSLAKYGKHMDYDTLKDKSIEECAQLLIEGKLKHDTHWNHWLPQTNWLLDDQGEIIVDYIGKVEDIALHIGNISRKLNKKIDVLNINSSGKQNKTTHCNLRSETLKLIENYYKKDFELLNYTTL